MATIIRRKKDQYTKEDTPATDRNLSGDHKQNTLQEEKSAFLEARRPTDAKKFEAEVKLIFG